MFIAIPFIVALLFFVISFYIFYRDSDFTQFSSKVVASAVVSLISLFISTAICAGIYDTHFTEVNEGSYAEIRKKLHDYPEANWIVKQSLEDKKIVQWEYREIMEHFSSLNISSSKRELLNGEGLEVE
jgi:hypothetical protein